GAEPVASESAPTVDDVQPAPAPAQQGSKSGSGPVKVEPVDVPGRSDGCSEGMVRVKGEYCPEVIQEGLEHHPDWEKHQGEPGVAERCLRYKDPSVCVSKKRVHMSFCMDRYEYPNRPGELPRVLTSWEQASAVCAEEGKRLCTEPEFNFACEG